MRRLILLLGDQLSHDLSALDDVDPAADTVLMAELAEETGYVRHHPKKIAFFLSAMRHFAEELQAREIPLDYIQLDQAENTGSISGEVERAIRRHRPDRVICTHPDEWRVLRTMQGWQDRFGVPVEIRPDRRFLCDLDWFGDWLQGRKQPRMEWFYREMRKATGFLMTEDGEPEGGAWNYDKQNRERLPDEIAVPQRQGVAPDAITEQVLELVASRFGDHFGTLDGFDYAVTAEQAGRQFDAFIRDCLADYGRYQDAMAAGRPFLFHAVAALYMNTGLLDPRAMCEAAEAAYRAGDAPLNAVEGFIRQIIGWREYVRGLYWHFMPGYRARNALGADRPLPDFYWTGDTDLACLAETIGDTRQHAYAHHIQRLMITGNFALLAGLDPAAVNEWYLIVYADAVEWVQLPNTHGMALWADGGLMGSKPYAASGKYIDRMSDYCAGCRYDPKRNTGPNACPFNFLYWDFIARNRKTLQGNHRMRMIYASLDRMDDDKVSAMRRQASRFLKEIAP